MSIVLPKDHIFLSSKNDIEAICNPLFEKSGIVFFDQVRVFDDGSSYILSNHTGFINYVLEKEYSPITPFPPNLIQKKFHYFIPTNGPYNHVMHDIRSFFNVANALDFVEQGDGYIDMFCFAGDAFDENIINFYLNNIDLLENFILEFKEKTIVLQQQAESQKIFLPPHMRTNIDSQGIIAPNTFEKVNKDKRKKQSTLFVTKNNHQVSITKREMDCLNKLTLGYSAKEIAKLLSLSHRTVEDHLQNAKDKLECSKRSEVIRILLNQKNFMQSNHH